MSHNEMIIPVASPVTAGENINSIRNISKAETEHEIIPSAAASSSSVVTLESYYDETSTREYLNSLDWPIGFQDAYLEGLEVCPMRYFIIDDSGSMHTSDAKRFIKKQNSSISVTTSRWTELLETIDFHANLTKYSKCTTEFRLLNNFPPIIMSGEGGENENNNTNSYQTLLRALQEPPNGSTPLCKHVKEIIQKITLIAPILRSTGKKVKLIIATDGEASDGDLAETMRPLCQLPVWIVVRLCTNNPQINQYWMDIDAELELNMDVIQNLAVESQEIYTLNPWLNYTEPFHRLRETGILLKEADLLDECRLSSEQIRNICLLIYGKRYKDNLAHPEIDLSLFISQIKTFQMTCTPLLNPISRNIEPLINYKQVTSHIRRQQSSNMTWCTLC